MTLLIVHRRSQKNEMTQVTLLSPILSINPYKISKGKILYYLERGSAASRRRDVRMGIYVDTQFGNLGEDLLTFFQANNVKTCFFYDSPEEKRKCIIALVLLDNKKHGINLDGGNPNFCEEKLKAIEVTMNEIKRQFDLPIISIIHKSDNSLIDHLARFNIYGTTQFQFKTYIKIYGILNSLMNLENDIDTNPKSRFDNLWKEQISLILENIFNKDLRFGKS